MRLVLLGSTGYHPNESRETACMLLPDHGVLLDAGTAMYRLPRYLRTSELDIFLTHAHLDHVIGLTYLFSVASLHRLDKVRVHGEAEKLRAIDEHMFAEPLFPTRPPMEFVPLADAEPLAGGGRLIHFPLRHQGSSVGYRLDWPGHSMAYVTDTTALPDAEYVEAIRGVDLLLHECYFGDEQAEFARRTGHSHTTPVAEIARRAAVGRLVLVHINPLATGEDPIGLSTARAIFPSTVLGEDFMELEF